MQIQGVSTRVLVEQTTAVDPQRPGEPITRLGRRDMEEIDDALRVVLGLHA